jgi:hypothetical protein
MLDGPDEKKRLGLLRQNGTFSDQILPMPLNLFIAISFVQLNCGAMRPDQATCVRSGCGAKTRVAYFPK